MYNDGRSHIKSIRLPDQRSTNSASKTITALRSRQKLASIQQLPTIGNRQTSPLSEVCYTISGRDFLYQDSLILWTGDPTFTADGNVIVSGEFADYSTAGIGSVLIDGGFCMKTDMEGNVIWAKLYDSTAHTDFDYMNYFKSIELRNGSILLAGRTTNKFSKNDDFVLTMLDNNGNIIWLKTYESKFWQGFNGSGDYFLLQDLKEDPTTGEIYFVGAHWGGASTITKVDPANGQIIWSTGYQTYAGDQAFGIVINSNDLLLFQLQYGSYNDCYINVIALAKSNGDTLYTKNIRQTGPDYEGRLFRTFGVVKQDNGHFLLSGPTTLYFEFPVYTGTRDLYHAGIIELDENLNFVKAWGFKNRVESNGYNTKISLNPDGTGVFTMFHYISGYNGEAHISLFKNDIIYHQRKRVHINEGIPYEPPTLRMPDGGFLNIKQLGDSTVMSVDGSRIDYYRMHTSDTASACLGQKDSATSIWYFYFEPHPYSRIAMIHKNVFKESRIKTFKISNFTAAPQPACQIISHCDSLAIEADAAIVCPGTSVVVTIHKNKECGSLVPLVYDTNWVKYVTRLTDTTYSFQFRQPGKGYIHASLLGCTLREDSVSIEVLPARNSLDLGKDTVICPGNLVTINAGKGFASYLWQDGSIDSTFTVTMPGIYYVTAMNGCGNIYYDTVEVRDHLPVSIDIGYDRTKCNNDTLHLNAPSGFLNYTWSNNYNISSTTSQNVVINPLKDTTYYIKAEKTAGCFAYDTVRVTVYHSPSINLGADKSFCSGDSVVFNAGNGFNQYLWSNNNTLQQITVKNTGTFSVIGTTVEGCKSYDTAKVTTIFTNPVVNLDHTNFLCAGSTRTLDAGNFSSYIWNEGSTGRSIIVKDIGSYSVEVTDNKGCKGSDTTIITHFLPLPADFLPPDTAICSYSKMVLMPGVSYSTYLWSNNATTPSITISQPGIYWLQVKDENNCAGRDSILVTPKQCMEGFYMPTAFTPNNDGKNDMLRPMLFGNVIKYKFTVYNRWGEVVFQTADLSKGWTGNYKRLQQPADVYIWTCTYQFEGEEIKNEKGTVVLIY
jgi:gliding motility-associated-like protein